MFNVRVYVFKHMAHLWVWLHLPGLSSKIKCESVQSDQSTKMFTLKNFQLYCMQYWLKKHWPDQALFKHSLLTNSISNSAILHNNYILLLSDLCTCVHVKKKWRCKGSHSSSVSGSNCLVSLQTCRKAMGWCTAQWKMLMQKPSWKSHTNIMQLYDAYMTISAICHMVCPWSC